MTEHDLSDRYLNALVQIRQVISEADPEVVTDTLWMPGPCPETVVDFIDATLACQAGTVAQEVGR